MKFCYQNQTSGGAKELTWIKFEIFFFRLMVFFFFFYGFQCSGWLTKLNKIKQIKLDYFFFLSQKTKTARSFARYVTLKQKTHMIGRIDIVI